MSTFTTFGANSVLDGTGIPEPLYIQLHTGNPGLAATANVSAIITDRQEFTRPAAAGGSAASDALIEWAPAGPGSETITHVSAWSLAVAGNPWITGPLVVPVPAITNDVLQIPIASLVMALS